MSDDAAKLVEKALDRDQTSRLLMIGMEAIMNRQRKHAEHALVLILDNKIAEAKHELTLTHTFMEQCREPLRDMKLRFIAAEEWIRKHGLDILDAEVVESGVDAGAAVKDAADILAKFCGK